MLNRQILEVELDFKKESFEMPPDAQVLDAFGQSDSDNVSLLVLTSNSQIRQKYRYIRHSYYCKKNGDIPNPVNIQIPYGAENLIIPIGGKNAFSVIFYWPENSYEYFR